MRMNLVEFMQEPFDGFFFAENVFNSRRARLDERLLIRVVFLNAARFFVQGGIGEGVDCLTFPAVQTAV